MLHGKCLTMLRIYACYTKGSHPDKEFHSETVRKKGKFIDMYVCLQNVVLHTLAGDVVYFLLIKAINTMKGQSQVYV